MMMTHLHQPVEICRFYKTMKQVTIIHSLLGLLLKSNLGAVYILYNGLGVQEFVTCVI